MKATALKMLKRALALIADGLLVLVLAWRVYDSLRAPPLERWHTFVPSEASAAQIAKLDWAGYLAGREEALRAGAQRGHRQARARGTRVESNRYFSRQPDLPRPLRAGLEPLLRAGARGHAGRRGGAAARPDRFALQPAPRGAALRAGRLCGGGDPPARPRHRARGPEQGRVGAVDGGHAPGGARGAAPVAGADAAARHRLFQRRRAGHEVRARRARRQGAGAARPHRAVRADDRHHQHGALCRRVRLAGAVPGLRQGGVAGHRARVQPLQVQQLPGQRRAPVLAGGAAAAGADRPPCARGQPEGPGAGADLPVGGGLHRQHARHRQPRCMPSCRPTAANWCSST